MKALMVAVLALVPSVALAEVGPPPPMSDADKRQMTEDMKIIGTPVELSVGVADAGPRFKRLKACLAYWEDKMHHARHPDARQFLYGIRVARCMFVEKWTIVHGPCKPYKVAMDYGWRAGVALHDKLECYAPFERVKAVEPIEDEPAE